MNEHDNDTLGLESFLCRTSPTLGRKERRRVITSRPDARPGLSNCSAVERGAARRAEGVELQPPAPAGVRQAVREASEARRRWWPGARRGRRPLRGDVSAVVVVERS